MDPAFMAVTHEEPEPVPDGPDTAGCAEEMHESVAERLAITEANAEALGTPTLHEGSFAPGMD